MPGDEPQASRGPVMMMPFFMGGPWVQKFSGTDSEVTFGAWKEQVQNMLTLQGLSAGQQLHFILGVLEGEDKREVLAVAAEERDTPEKLFALLRGLYGDNTPVAALRAQFFNYRQEARQSIRAFSLRLRELFFRLERRDDTGLEGGDMLLRDQFVMGLREGPIQQELRAQVRRNRRLAFEDVRKEALALESERQDLWAPSTPVFTQNVAVEPAADWKQMLRRELMQKVKEQFTEMSKTFFEELRQNRSSLTNYPGGESYLAQANGNQRIPGRPANDRFKWNAKGIPVCNGCGEVGHIRRQCPTRQNSQLDF